MQVELYISTINFILRSIVNIIYNYSISDRNITGEKDNIFSSNV